jgi:hypothetical protein
VRQLRLSFLLVPIWNEIVDASVFGRLTRIHQPFLVALACADEAPMLTNAPKRATATTEPIHCVLVFIWLVLICVFPFSAGYAESALAPNEK